MARPQGDFLPSISLYNTLTRRVEPFQPYQPERVRMYVCGPTVYDLAHIGNARPVVVFDVLFRLLRLKYGHQSVIYARNITDVDDKIIARASELQCSIEELTRSTIQFFHQDMAALGALSPTYEPRASEYIPQMQVLVERLLVSGHAYQDQGHVLFHVPAMPDYGQLSRRTRDEMIAGARVEVAPYKRDPADFVLWKPSTPEQPGWNSPWGRGRPGWHLECSAMSERCMELPFDIHGGGGDLMFPHHENEIAQSSCTHAGVMPARFWLHNGFVTLKGDKMAKSAGNSLTVRTLLEQKWKGEVIRLSLLSTHYRRPLDFSRKTLEQAQSSLGRWYTALDSSECWDEADPSEHEIPAEVYQALADNLNTPQAIGHLHKYSQALNRATCAAERQKLSGALRAGAGLLGLLTVRPSSWFTDTGAASNKLTAQMIDELIDLRHHARLNRNFAEADRIRGQLAEQGIALSDTQERTTWRCA